MTAKSREDDFDCLAFKDHAQSEIYEATKDMPRSGFREYLDRRVEAGPFSEFWRDLTSRPAPSSRLAETR